MLRILYYLCKKLGKISTKKGGGLILRHGRILHILRYTRIHTHKCTHAHRMPHPETPPTLTSRRRPVVPVGLGPVLF